MSAPCCPHVSLVGYKEQKYIVTCLPTVPFFLPFSFHLLHSAQPEQLRKPASFKIPTSPHRLLTSSSTNYVGLSIFGLQPGPLTAYTGGTRLVGSAVCNSVPGLCGYDIHVSSRHVVSPASPSEPKFDPVFCGFFQRKFEGDSQRILSAT